MSHGGRTQIAVRRWCCALLLLLVVNAPEQAKVPHPKENTKNLHQQRVGVTAQLVAARQAQHRPQFLQHQAGPDFAEGTHLGLPWHEAASWEYCAKLLQRWNSHVPCLDLMSPWAGRTWHLPSLVSRGFLEFSQRIRLGVGIDRQLYPGNVLGLSCGDKHQHPQNLKTAIKSGKFPAPALVLLPLKHLTRNFCALKVHTTQLCLFHA